MPHGYIWASSNPWWIYSLTLLSLPWTRSRAAIPDRDLQLRLIHMLMGGRGGNGSMSGTTPASPSDSGDSGAQKQHSSSSASPPPSEQVGRHFALVQELVHWSTPVHVTVGQGAAALLPTAPPSARLR